jgi:MerR family transcriptional regulator/heat shock protein HspR
MKNQSNEPVYVISVAARLAGLPCWTLRLLDQEGVVVPVRTEKNHRMYSDDDVSKLEYIRYLTEERGVNIAGVKLILEMNGQPAQQSQQGVRTNGNDFSARGPTGRQS